jgi:hypothetical protein
MWKKFANMTLGICLCSILLACGMAGRGDAVTFNDSIAKSNSKCDNAVKGLVDQMSAGIRGQPGAVAAFKKGVADAKQTVNTAKAEVQAIKVLPKQSAKDFYDAEIKYLAMREKNIDDFGEMVRMLEDNNMNQAIRSQKIIALATKIEDDEKKALAVLQAAQSTFAKDHNIIILPK